MNVESDVDMYNLATRIRDIFREDAGSRGKMLASKAVEEYAATKAKEASSKK